MQFAVASDSNYTYSGILGLGYAYPIAMNYPSVLNLMVSQKYIGAPIFSLGLGGEQDGFSECLVYCSRRCPRLTEKQKR